MGGVENDSIANYTTPLASIRLGGPYTLKQFDSVLTPYHLQILNGIQRFNARLSNPGLPHRERIFALKVLIGLNTAMALPLNVTDLPSRDELLKHDIFFLRDLNGDYMKRSVLANTLYGSYKSGIQVKLAKGNDRMINAFMESGYRQAAQLLSWVLSNAFISDNKRRFGETPISRILEPDKDPVYWRDYAMTLFPGSPGAQKKFLDQNLQYPADEWKKGIEGTCILNFIVEKDGSLSHIAVEYGVTPDIDTEAVRVMHLSPKWLPAHFGDRDTTVRSDNFIYIDFKIKPGVKRKDTFKAPLLPN